MSLRSNSSFKPKLLLRLGIIQMLERFDKRSR